MSHCMLERQIAIVVKESHVLYHYKRLYGQFLDKLESVMESYYKTFYDFITY